MKKNDHVHEKEVNFHVQDKEHDENDQSIGDKKNLMMMNLMMRLNLTLGLVLWGKGLKKWSLVGVRMRILIEGCKLF